MAFGFHPKFVLDRRQTGPAGDRGMPCEHATNVAAEDRESLAVCLRENRPGRGAADAGPCSHRREVARKLAALFGHNGLRAAMPVARARVAAAADRKGVVWGKVVYSSGGRGGARSHKK